MPLPPKPSTPPKPSSTPVAVVAAAEEVEELPPASPSPGPPHSQPVSVPPSACPSGVRFIAASGGSDRGNSGCDEASPLATLGACAEQSGDGETCYFLAGTHYARSSNATLIRRRTNLTLAPAPSVAAGAVTIDGTMPLRGWTAHTDERGAGYYKSAASYDTASAPWQLFLNGAALTPARWPDAEAWTAAWYDRDATWARQTSAATCGRMVDAAWGGRSLAGLGASLDGCNAIVNNEHWVTRRYRVENHTAGSATFDYSREGLTDDFSFCRQFHADAASNRYFVDGCLAVFDAPGEWARDGDGRLRVRLPSAHAGAEIGELEIRGKMQAYAFACVECDGLVVRGLRFFATTLLVYRSRGVRLEENVFHYPSASRRALGGEIAEVDGTALFGIPPGVAKYGLTPLAGSYAVAIPTTWIGQAGAASAPTASAVVNNEVRYAEGPGFACAWCAGDVWANNLVHMAAHPFGRALQFEGLATHDVTLRRNTLEYSGSGGIGWLWGRRNLAELNRIRYAGMLIVDNEGIQGGRLTSESTFRFNWVSDGGGLGLRFDAGETGEFGRGNRLQFNVVFRNVQGGLAGKSDNASTYRNTGTDQPAGVDDLRLYECYPSSCEATARDGASVPAHTNRGSVTRGNVGRIGHGTSRRLYAEGHLPGVHDHNLNLRTAPAFGATAARERRALYRAYEHGDFRPRPGGPLVDAGADSTPAGASAPDPVPGAPPTLGVAPDIGAYEHSHSVYWLPGRRLPHASSPVPPSGSVGVRPDQELLFLPGAAARLHRVVLDGVASELAGERNVFAPPARLVPGSRHTWRVDEYAADGALLAAGPEWTFAVGCMDVDCADCGAATTEGSCRACDAAAGATLVDGRCAVQGGCASGWWDVNVTSTAGWSPGCSYRAGGETCAFTGIAGAYTDALGVACGDAGATCEGTRHEMFKLVRNGAPLSEGDYALLSGGNAGINDGALPCCDAANGFSIVARWGCARCDAGFVADASVSSGCRANAT